jgi:Regulator of chromosome condensation (RCC1) repeat
VLSEREDGDQTSASLPWPRGRLSVPRSGGGKERVRWGGGQGLGGVDWGRGATAQPRRRTARAGRTKGREWSDVRCAGWLGGARGWGCLLTVALVLARANAANRVTTVKLSAGGDRTCIVTTEDSVRCWGDAGEGGLGYGNSENIGDNEYPSSLGNTVVSLGASAVSVSAGDDHTCALSTSSWEMGGIALVWAPKQRSTDLFPLCVQSPTEQFGVGA